MLKRMREEIDVLNLGEAEVYLEDVGPEDAPAIVVLHGGPGGSSYGLREGIGDELGDFRVLYLDQRGSGRSPVLPEEPRLFTVDALVRDLEALRYQLRLDSWTLLGHGFGAIPALEYARRFEEQVDGVVLVNPWVNFPWLAEQLFRASLVLRGMSADLEPPPEPDLTLADAFSSLEPKAVFDALMFPNLHSRLEYEWLTESGSIVGNDGPGQMFVFNGLWSLDYSPYLLHYPRAVSVIVGSKDGTSYPEAEKIADLTGGMLEVIGGAGHYPWIDEPYAFSEALNLVLDNFEGE